MFKVSLLALFGSAALFAGTVVVADVPAPPDLVVNGDYQYDARMAFIKAGDLSLTLDRRDGAYEVRGEFKTSQAMSLYYTWNGVFAAVGTWRGLGPVTTAYMSRTSSKDDDLKIVLNYPDGAKVLEDGEKEFRTVERPGGIDLISALFFSPECYDGGLVHDGEDNYLLTLRKEWQHELGKSERYHDGQVTSCDYGVVDHKGRKRRVVVSMAPVDGTMVAVQVRAKIPLLPDAVFRLRRPLPIEDALARSAP